MLSVFTPANGAGAGLAWRRARARRGSERHADGDRPARDERSNAAPTRPRMGPSAAELIRRGKAPSQLHNNCSGKHANFLALARHLGHDHHRLRRRSAPGAGRGRRGADEPDGRHIDRRTRIDGCSIPTYAVPLSALALAFARFRRHRDIPHAPKRRGSSTRRP